MVLLTEYNVAALYRKFKKGPRKSKKFYMSLVELYSEDPYRFQKIFDILPTIGYYKDYFYILEAVSEANTELSSPVELASLTTFVYQRIFKLVKGWEKNKYITLAKWMPREGTHFDRKLGFVKKFSEMLFPNAKWIERKKMYRKLVSDTCNVLNTLESNLSQKTYENITTLTNNNVKVYGKSFNNNDVLRSTLESILEKKYLKTSLPKLLSIYSKTKFETSLDVTIIRPLISKIIESKITSRQGPSIGLAIEPSASMINHGRYLMHSKALQHLASSDKIMIGGKIVTVDPNLPFKTKMDLVEKNITIGSPEPTRSTDSSSMVILSTEKGPGRIQLKLKSRKKKSEVETLKSILKKSRLDVKLTIGILLLYYCTAVVLKYLFTQV